MGRSRLFRCSGSALVALVALSAAVAPAACSSFSGATEEPAEGGAADAGTGDGAGTADAPPGVAPEGGNSSSKLVFVSKSRLTVAGGLQVFAGIASNRCDADGKVQRPGSTFVAWFSTKTKNAIELLPNDGEWKIPGGDVIFASRAAITSGKLGHAIDQTADGNNVPAGTYAWTNTNAGGAIAETGATACQDFSSASGSLSARVGLPADSTDSKWTDAVALACDKSAAVICFEL